MKPQTHYLNHPKVFSLLFVLFSLTHLYAKDFVVDGFYINLKGDTIRSKFVLSFHNVKRLDESQSKMYKDDLYTRFKNEWLPDFKKIQWKIHTLNDSNGKNELLPTQCKAFEFIYERDTFKYITHPNEFYARKNNFLYAYYPDSIFIQVIVSGPISLYQFFKTNTMVHRFKGYGYVAIDYKKARYLLKKQEDVFCLHYNKSFFRKKLKKYIADSPSVLSKIEYGKYKVSDIVEIIKDYNGSCMSKRH